MTAPDKPEAGRQDGELKPCPFCGGEPERYTAIATPGFEDRQVNCRSCGASAFDLKWNTRAADPTHAKLDRAREALRAVSDAMLLGGDGQVGDYGWSITLLNRARPLIRAALTDLDAKP